MTDAQSEEIYSARIAFRDTFDYRFVQDYLDQYLQEYHDRKWLYLSDDLKKKLSGYEKVIVAGAGQRGKALAVMLGKEGYHVDACSITERKDSLNRLEFRSKNRKQSMTIMHA